MRTILYIAAFCLFLQVHAGPDTLVMRRLLAEAVNSSRAAEDLYLISQTISTDSKPILLGFKGMAELIQCKHVLNPMSKITHFRKGRVLLEKALSVAPANYELRYYRYCTQLNVPSFIGYSSNLKEDKAFLFDYLRTEGKNKKKDVDLYVRIKTFLLTNKHATTEDKERLKEL